MDVDDADDPITDRSKKRKERDSPASQPSQQATRDPVDNEGWSDFEIDDDELNLSVSGDQAPAKDAMDVDTEDSPKKREAKYRKGLSRQQRKFVERMKKAGDTRGTSELLEYRRKIEADYIQVRDEQQRLLKEAKERKNDSDSVETTSTAGLTNESTSTQGNANTETPGTPRRRGAGSGRGSERDSGGRGGRGGRGGGRDPLRPQAVVAPPANNVNAALMNVNAREHAFYASVNLTVEKSSQATAVMRKAGQNVLIELQKVNPSACFQIATMKGNDGRGAITNADQIPKTLIGMEDYFLSGRPKPDGGTIYNRMKIAFNGDEHTFWSDVQQPLKRVNAQIYRDALPDEPLRNRESYDQELPPLLEHGRMEFLLGPTNGNRSRKGGRTSTRSGGCLRRQADHGW